MLAHCIGLGVHDFQLKGCGLESWSGFQVVVPRLSQSKDLQKTFILVDSIYMCECAV